jgi:hypothetical protein
MERQRNGMNDLQLTRAMKDTHVSTPEIKKGIGFGK